jgi:hypothetical protein
MSGSKENVAPSELFSGLSEPRARRPTCYRTPQPPAGVARGLALHSIEFSPLGAGTHVYINCIESFPLVVL